MFDVLLLRIPFFIIFHVQGMILLDRRLQQLQQRLVSDHDLHLNLVVALRCLHAAVADCGVSFGLHLLKILRVPKLTLTGWANTAVLPALACVSKISRPSLTSGRCLF